jgi:hypothetical protein
MSFSKYNGATPGIYSSLSNRVIDKTLIGIGFGCACLNSQLLYARIFTKMSCGEPRGSMIGDSITCKTFLNDCTICQKIDEMKKT